MTLGQQTRRKHKHAIVPKPGPQYCHPKYKTANGSCLPAAELSLIARALKAPNHLTKKNLKHWIRNRTRCRTERCWVEKAPIHGSRKQEILRNYFRPKMPEEWKGDPDMWLDSLNIADVMKQYEEAYPHFKFFGTNPIDFAAPDPNVRDKMQCVQEEICNLRLDNLKAQGKTSLGFVYNLDPHDKGGSHWIASYTDIPGHKSYYIDSYGMKPPPQIARFLRSLTLQDPLMKLFYSERRLQYSDSECGMYCIYFLIRMLEGDTFKQFIRRRPTDKDMLGFRKWIFSNDE